MNAPIVQLFAVDRGPVRAADRMDLAVDGVRRRSAEQQPAQRAHADRSAADQAGPDPGRRRHGAGALGPARGRAPGGGRIRPARCSLSRSATRTAPPATPRAWSCLDGPELRGMQTGLSVRVRPARRHAAGRRRRLHDARSQGPADGAGSSWPGAPARWWRSIRRPARSRSCTPTRATTTTTRTRPAAAATTFNRSTQGQYPPGSTFKVVTATAAIDSGKYTPNSIVNGHSPVTISGVPLSNDNNQSFGQIDLTTALTYSVNTVWAQVGESLGRATMTKYMKRFGFYSKPPLDYPPNEINTSRPYAPNGTPVPARQPQRGHRPDRHRPGRPAGDAAADGHGRVGGGQRRQADGAALRHHGGRSRTAAPSRRSSRASTTR